MLLWTASVSLAHELERALAVHKSMNPIADPYDIFDPVLEPWAAAHGFTLYKLYRDDAVRTVWPQSLHNPEAAGQRPQLWLGWPIVEGVVDVCVAVGRWSHRAPASLDTMRAVLDQELGLLAARCAQPPR